MVHRNKERDRDVLKRKGCMGEEKGALESESNNYLRIKFKSRRLCLVLRIGWGRMGQPRLKAVWFGGLYGR